MASVHRNEEGVFEVVIAGLRLRLRSSHSDEQVQQLVQSVEQKISQVQQNNPMVSFQNALVLAALHLAEVNLSDRYDFKEQLEELKLDSLEILSEIEASPINQKNLDL